MSWRNFQKLTKIKYGAWKYWWYSFSIYKELPRCLTASLHHRFLYVRPVTPATVRSGSMWHEAGADSHQEGPAEEQAKTVQVRRVKGCRKSVVGLRVIYMILKNAHIWILNGSFAYLKKVGKSGLENSVQSWFQGLTPLPCMLSCGRNARQ